MAGLVVGDDDGLDFEDPLAFAGWVCDHRQMGYDVIIIGGAFTGASVAWWLTANQDFDGTILVVERDPTYTNASTSHSNSCIRQQFSHPLNVQIGLFGVDYIRNFRANIAASLAGDDLAGDVPDIFFHNFGYLYLADDEPAATRLRHNRDLQIANGARTQHLTATEISERWPFINTDDVLAGNHNPFDEGYFDSGTMFEWWRRTAKRKGVKFIHDEVVAIHTTTDRVTGVELASGDTHTCGTIINAAGPRAGLVAQLANIELPVEARKRYTFVFRSAENLGADLPLIIDPSGVHVRQDGDAFMAGATPDDDPPVEFDDFDLDPNIFEAKVWPALVHRVPAFERIKVISEWAGHYAYNSLDQNVVVGAHPALPNFIFANGFSGHGLQQSPAVGRAVCELVTYGQYQTLDLTELGFERIINQQPFPEHNVI